MYELTRIYNGTSRKKKSMKKSEENILIQKKDEKKAIQTSFNAT